MPHPLEPILHELVSILGRCRIPYAVMGGMAVRVWSFPRATYDVDLTLWCAREDLHALNEALTQEGFTVPDQFAAGYLDQLHGMDKLKVQFYAGRQPIDIDFFLVTTEYQRTAFSRRRFVDLESLKIWCMSPEDLILHKLIANRDRDKADVLDLLMAAPPLDFHYLQTWAKELGVLDLLESKVRECRSFGFEPEP